MRKRYRWPTASRGLSWAALCGALVLWPGSARVAAGADTLEKLRFFGYLTQAYGRTDLGSIRGATREGTTDLRNLAVQLRWEISEDDSVVVQFSHERRGSDIFFPEHDEIDLDWAFYERRFGANTSLKVGRLNIPLGIYNEVRDVGTLLPFFDLPVSFYAGVLSSAETVDGASISHIFAARSEWDLEVELYFGGWDTFQQQVSPDADFGLVNLEARGEDGLGLQLWLNTPVRGLRLGAGILTWLLDGPISKPGSRDRWKSYHLSVDAAREKWVLRAEYRNWRFDQDFGGFLGLPVSLIGKAKREGYYVQTGFWITDEIGVFGQLEDTSLGDNLGLLPELEEFHEDAAVALNYRFHPDLLAKAEYHRSETRFPLGDPSLPMGVGGQPLIEVDWVVLALSISF